MNKPGTRNPELGTKSGALRGLFTSAFRLSHFAILLSLTACGRHVTDSNLDQVKPDMSSKEVESILGQPSRVKTHELTLQTQMKTLPAQRYYYEQNGRTVELIFVNDKLIGKEGSFDNDATPAINPAAK